MRKGKTIKGLRTKLPSTRETDAVARKAIARINKWKRTTMD